MFDARKIIEHELRNLAQARGLSEVDVRFALELDSRRTVEITELLRSDVCSMVLDVANRLLIWRDMELLRRRKVDAELAQLRLDNLKVTDD
jgi:hypothetical protein